MKEKVLEALNNLGFTVEQIDDNAFCFEYEGMSFLYLYSPNDEEFLSIALPSVYDFDENEAGKYCALTESINSSQKYIKAYTANGSLWIFYEREIMEGDDVEETVRRMILHLQGGMFALKKVLEATSSSSDDDGSDEEAANGSEE